MTFDPDTTEHLGICMYSIPPPTLAGLIANAHDTDAENVLLTLNNSERTKRLLSKTTS